QINLPLVPASTTPGGGSFTLTVNGTGFVPGSVVKWSGKAETTQFVSGNRLTATILASDIGAPKTASVVVVNPIPGGGHSNVAYFQVTGSAAALSLHRSDFAAGPEPRFVTTADFNRDAKFDLAICTSGDDTVSILLGNGDETFQARVAYTTGSAPLAVTVA